MNIVNRLETWIDLFAKVARLACPDHFRFAPIALASSLMR